MQIPFLENIQLKAKALFRVASDLSVTRKVVYAIKFFTTKGVISAASALTYSTLLAIVPLCAVVFAIARGFGFSIYIEQWFRGILSSQPEAADVIIGFVNSYLVHAKSGIILGVGLLFMFYTVLSLTRSIEQTFNDIWHVDNRKTNVRTFADYLIVLFIAPIVLILISGVSMFIVTLSTSSEWKDVLGPVAETLVDIVPFVILWFVFAAIYVYLPNTKVRWRNAFGPAVLSTIAMLILQWGYIHAQMLLSGYNAIYGSFAALPLFMLWIQLSWTICLFGAELTYTNQNLERFSEVNGAASMSHRNRIIVSCLLLSHICKRFEKGEHPYTALQLKSLSNIPNSVACDLLTDLVKAGIIVEVDAVNKYAERTYLPAMAIKHITVGMVIDRLEAEGKQEFSISLKNNIKSPEKWEALVESRNRYLDELRKYKVAEL